ncbi:MAG TPA: hypothetical protein VN937_14055 [Blastocatellia bacterium]|nr:hypothetical protein [Blastocatellia bacterium]
MKKFKQVSILFTVLVMLALPVLAAAIPNQDEARNALYRSFVEKVKDDQAAAYQIGKEFITKYPTPDDQYLQYVKKYVAGYEDRLPRVQCGQALKDNKAEAFTLCKPVVAKTPDDLSVLASLATTGLSLTGNDRKTNSADAVSYARKAIELVNAGKTFEAGKPLPNKDLLLASLNYIVGALSLETDPAGAAKALIAAAKSESDYKKVPQVYSLLAEAYRLAEYDKLSQEMSAKCSTAEQQATPECKALTDKVNDVTDRMIDALARAVAYAGTSTDAKAKTASEGWKKSLATLYKFRKGSEDGMEAYIASVTAKPLQ